MKRGIINLVLSKGRLRLLIEDVDRYLIVDIFSMYDFIIILLIVWLIFI